MDEFMTEVECRDRWQAYYRFKDLGIHCECRAYQPLRVRVDNPSQMLQVWSALQAVSSDRHRLISRLQRCWKLSQPRSCYFCD